MGKNARKDQASKNPATEKSNKKIKASPSKKAPKKNKQEELPDSLTGSILVAMPHMKDPRFHQAVIFICGHDDKGAMGIVLNKLVEGLTLSQILTQMSLETQSLKQDIPVHYGGPVETGRGFTLHSPDYHHEASIQISKDVILTTNAEVLQVMAVEKKPKNKILALGYAGWGAGQLEKEMATNAWLQVPADLDLIFHTSPAKCWTKALGKLGISPGSLSLTEGHA